MSGRASGFAVTVVIARRELVRFARQPARIAAAIGTPLVLWLFMGSGFAGSFRPVALAMDDASYLGFMLPGAMTLVAVFAAIFSSISIIEDRNEGWLQAVLVAPAPRWGLALGKTLGGSIVAFAQAAVLLVAAPFLGLDLAFVGVLLSLAALAATCIAMTALGVVFAWRSETTAGFHAVMNLVFMPMWLLSGAFFPPPPPGSDAAWLGWLMRINPLTWCTEAIRAPLLDDMSMRPLLFASAFAIVMLAAATISVSRRVLPLS